MIDKGDSLEQHTKPTPTILLIHYIMYLELHFFTNQATSSVMSQLSENINSRVTPTCYEKAYLNRATFHCKKVFEKIVVIVLLSLLRLRSLIHTGNCIKESHKK